MSLHQTSLSLGIDIGTTKVACCLVDPQSRSSVASSSEVHRADVSGLKTGRSEQRVSDILRALDLCMNQLPLEGRAKVGAIGITGQMHGVLLWNEGGDHVTDLITWQDQRCLEEGFLAEIQQTCGDNSLQTGYGVASLAWLARHNTALLRSFRCAGTIHDYLAALIAGRLGSGVTDPSDAASFGCFDLSRSAWNEEAIVSLGIPFNLMAQIKGSGEQIGGLNATFSQRWGIQEGVPICNAIGDNQASIYGSLRDPETQVALTIGTGAQLSVVVPDLPDNGKPSRPTFEYRPYVGRVGRVERVGRVGESFLAVAASLSGGRALASLAATLESFMKSCGVENPPTRQTIQSAMHETGMAKINTDLRANASLGGERHSPDLRGSFSNLTFDNFTIADMTAAMCRGLVTSLKDAIPGELLRGKTEVVGSGNGIHRSALMQQVIREVFQCELVINTDREITACGAGLLAARSHRLAIATRWE